MPPQMTSTAYGQGAKNALACGAGFLVMWLLIGEAIWQATGRPISDSFAIAFALLWGVVFMGFLAGWLFGRRAGGSKCGRTASGRIGVFSDGARSNRTVGQRTPRCWSRQEALFAFSVERCLFRLN